MRRFMQTLVLVPQSVRKYYLYCNIFRYQDEVFRDPLATPERDGAAAQRPHVGATLSPSDKQYRKSARDFMV
jgi:hypothetical protein